MTCTFFGHRDAPDGIRPILRKTIKEMIEGGLADRFYVGNEGAFDRMVQSELKRLKKEYPAIDYSVVLAYMPKKGDGIENTVFPEEAAACPRQFAVDKRNRWMIGKSDLAVVYVVRRTGGAVKYANVARNRGLRVVEIAGWPPAPHQKHKIYRISIDTDCD